MGRRRRNLGTGLLIASCVTGIFLLGALAAVTSVVLAANGIAIVAITAGAAAVGGFVAPYLVERGAAGSSLRLEPDAIDVTDQQQVFERALRAYAARLDVPVPATRLANSDRRTAPAVLTLHAAARAAVLGERSVITIDSEIFTELLEHEAHYWQTTADAVGIELDVRQCRQAVALSTLLGATQPSEAEELLAKGPGPGEALRPLCATRRR